MYNIINNKNTIIKNFLKILSKFTKKLFVFFEERMKTILNTKIN